MFPCPQADQVAVVAFPRNGSSAWETCCELEDYSNHMQQVKNRCRCVYSKLTCSTILYFQYYDQNVCVCVCGHLLLCVMVN